MSLVSSAATTVDKSATSPASAQSPSSLVRSVSLVPLVSSAASTVDKSATSPASAQSPSSLVRSVSLVPLVSGAASTVDKSATSPASAQSPTNAFTSLVRFTPFSFLFLALPAAAPAAPFANSINCNHAKSQSTYLPCVPFTASIHVTGTHLFQANPYLWHNHRTHFLSSSKLTSTQFSS